MEIRFWGVRGSIAVSGERYERTGGNTTCVEVRHEGHRLILDGGTGLRALGEHLGFQPLNATLLFTHVHWDHIQGVPFFAPAFHPDSQLTMVGVKRDSGGLRDALAAQMRPPTFPIGLEALAGAKHFRDIRADRAFDVGPFHITPLEQPHPDGVLAYRIEAGGKVFVFATDVEHGGEGVQRALVDLSLGADLLVHDAQYTFAEYAGHGGPSRKGWGHSTWDEALRCGVEARASRLALFHHDPTRSDQGVEAMEQAAQSRVATVGLPMEVFAAREGHAVAL